MSGGRLSGLPLSLRLRAKSTALSHRAPVYYADLTVREGVSLAEAVQQALSKDEAEAAAGFDRQGLEEAAGRGLANGDWEDSSEEIPGIVEELFNEAEGEAGASCGAEPVAEEGASGSAEARQGGTAGLKGKLLAKAGEK